MYVCVSVVQIFLADERTAWEEEEEVSVDRKSDVICCLNVYQGTRGAFHRKPDFAPLV